MFRARFELGEHRVVYKRLNQLFYIALVDRDDCPLSVLPHRLELCISRPQLTNISDTRGLR